MTTPGTRPPGLCEAMAPLLDERGFWYPGTHDPAESVPVLRKAAQFAPTQMRDHLDVVVAYLTKIADAKAAGATAREIAQIDDSAYNSSLGRFHSWVNQQCAPGVGPFVPVTGNPLS